MPESQTDWYHVNGMWKLWLSKNKDINDTTIVRIT